MEQQVFPSQRLSKPSAIRSIQPGFGTLGITKPFSGIVNAKSAYQNPLQIHTTPIQLSNAAVIPAAAPFSLAIRNASYNLNSDPRVLKFTPRSGLLPRIVNKEKGDECPLTVSAPQSCED